MNCSLKIGKRYFWLSQHGIKSGLYSGEHDENNGNVILIEKNGDRWSIPEKICKEYDKLKNKEGQ